MSNLNININLLKYKGAGTVTLTGKSGQPTKCLVIPIEVNHLYVGESGVYASFTAWRNDKLQDGKTHLIKQGLSKEVRAAMTQEEKLQMPTFGDVKPLTQTPANAEQYTTPAKLDDMPF